MNTIWWGVYVYVEVIYMRQLLCVLNVTMCIERIRFGGVYVYVSVFYVLVTVCIECYLVLSYGIIFLSFLSLHVFLSQVH